MCTGNSISLIYKNISIRLKQYHWKRKQRIKRIIIIIFIIKTNNDNDYYGNLSSFNRIKQSCLVRSDDAIEAIKSHAEYEQSTPEEAHEDTK